MAFDPIQEDCLRLVLSSMKREHVYPLENGPYVTSRIDAYRYDPDALIDTDADRAFHLVVRAAEIIDYTLPFVADDAEADAMLAQGEALLEEAVSLDPQCWDAERMLAAVRLPSVDDYCTYLNENVGRVLEAYEKTVASADNAYDREFASDLARRPYLRWLAASASKALIAGRYHDALKTAMRSLDIAPDDPADVRLTAALACAKLERDASEIDRLDVSGMERQPSRRGARRTPRTNAWIALARIATAYKELDWDTASRGVEELFSAYSGAAHVLDQQTEFPDGTFARVNVVPGSDDELALAVSEATPLLQEGVGAPDDASLAVWLAEHPCVRMEMDRLDRAQARALHRHRRPEDDN